jgi:hypothetical protein
MIRSAPRRRRPRQCHPEQQAQVGLESEHGFAGFAYRTDVAALRRGNGSKVLWNLREPRPTP